MTRRPRPLLAALIVLGFFLGQFCALIHASHDELIHQPDQPACAICAIAHAAGVRPTMPALLPVVHAPGPRPVPVVPRLENLQRVALPQSRAPPSFLA